MYKGRIIGTLTGFFFGIIISVSVNCVEDFLSCFGRSRGSGGSFISFFMVVICVVVGFIYGFKIDEENQRAENDQIRRELEAKRIREREEEERRKRATAERLRMERNAKVSEANKWEKNLINYFKKIENLKRNGTVEDFEYNLTKMYEQVGKFKEQSLKKAPIKDSNGVEFSYKKTFEALWEAHLMALKGEFYNLLFDHQDFCMFREANNTVTKMIVGSKDDIYYKLREVLDSFDDDFKRYCDHCYLDFGAYGECKLSFLEDVSCKEYLDENAKSLYFSIEKDILDMWQDCINGEDYAVFIEKFDYKLVLNAAMLMWYYALKKPFNLESFENCCKLLGRFTYHPTAVPNGEHIEVLLAKIYVKKNMGGDKIAAQELENIKKWLDKIIECNIKKVEGFLYLPLVSGLAWMELYDMERDVLRHLVAKGVQITSEMQERLGFLESGGKTNIKIYDIEKSENFLFDNSSLEWRTNEFDVFFRKLSMKNTSINYSLAITKWTKTLPLVRGQQVDNENICKEFQKMVNDFGDEVTYRKANSNAINLENLEYEDAVIFDFNSKKNRCISVLFHSEKFGRNLNLTIITLFTPNAQYSNEELKKYALAIKDNTYMESFRESILQSIDEVLKEKKSMYGDETPKTKQIFE